MEFKKIKKDYMKSEYAKQITEWKYNNEYSVYNLPSYEECVNEKYRITLEDEKNNYKVYILNNEVVFYYNIKKIYDDRICIGVGLKPEYCGKGLGAYFLNDCIKEIKNKFTNPILFVRVRSWNKRAIKAYEKVGFNILRSYIMEDRFGKNTEFVELEMI